MTTQGISITVYMDDKTFTVSRETNIDWEGYPVPGLSELLELVYQDARNGVRNVTPQAPF